MVLAVAYAEEPGAAPVEQEGEGDGRAEGEVPAAAPPVAPHAPDAWRRLALAAAFCCCMVAICTACVHLSQLPTFLGRADASCRSVEGAYEYIALVCNRASAAARDGAFTIAWLAGGDRQGLDTCMVLSLATFVLLNAAFFREAAAVEATPLREFMTRKFGDDVWQAWRLTLVAEVRAAPFAAFLACCAERFLWTQLPADCAAWQAALAPCSAAPSGHALGGDAAAAARLLAAVAYARLTLLSTTATLLYWLRLA